MKNGQIHSIDTFSTLDGPGIRTVIFMQGCHLRCRYCHNPDTWDCNSSVALKYSSEELFEIILRSIPYFKASGGGVTFSGGEPLLQHEFVKEVCLKCQQNNIHTAIDSSLYVNSDWVMDILPVTDLFLADIKHMDNESSRLITGASNKHNLANLQLINEEGKEIWIRYVVVPGLTDDLEAIKALGDFVSQLDSVKRIDLLPYHSLGSHKWGLLGLKYSLTDTFPPTSELIQKLKLILVKSSGKSVEIPNSE